MTERVVLTFREKEKLGERGLRHLKNECYDGAEQRYDYIIMDTKVEWW